MPAPLVFDFIGSVFTAILYGFYCMIFGLYWRIQLKRIDRWKGVLLYPLTAIFILCTVYFIIITIQTQFLITIFVERDDSLEAPFLWLSIANDAIYAAIDFISQLILFYRCWIMWHQPLVMVIPCTLSLAFLVTAMTTLGFNVKFLLDNIVPPPEWYLSAVTAFFFLSLVVNAVATGLIVYKIVSVYRDIRGFDTGSVQNSAHGNGRRDLYPLISILVESGLITFVGQLAQTVLYKANNDAFPIVGGCVVMLYGISTTIVLVRVEMGVTYDHSTSKSSYSTNSGRPIQLARFDSKNNQNTVVDFGGSDDLNDSRSERKLIRHH